MGRSPQHLKKKPKRTLGRAIVIALIVIVGIELAFNASWIASLLSGVPDIAPRFSPLRLGIEIALCAFAICVRPTSRLRDQPLSKPKASGVVVILIWLAFSLGICVAVCLSTNSTDYDTDDHSGTHINTMQYQLMADSLLEGKAFIDIDPPAWLGEMDDPYDYEERCALAEETGESPLFDYAYHEGHYYMYFGVLPSALLFAPYKALTGSHLSTLAATLFLVVLAVLALWALVLLVALRYTSKPSIADYLLYAIIGMLATSVIYLAFYPSFYHIAIASSLCFAFIGITLWIGSIRKDGTLRKGALFLGSLCLGCTLLCRPTLFLAVLLAFPIFWRQLRTDGRPRGFFALNKQALANTACILLPCIAIGCLAMGWNFVRFGSPLDFGANYNLTGFDMTSQHIGKSGFVYALYLYLIGMPHFTADFPFISAAPPEYAIIVEPYYEGLLFAVPAVIFFLSIFAKGVRTQLKESNAFGLVIFGILIGLAIMLVDMSVGVTQRYQADFHWLFLVALIPVLGALQGSLANKGREAGLAAVRIMLIGCVIVSALLAIQNLWSTERYRAYENSNPALYAEVQGWFEST